MKILNLLKTCVFLLICVFSTTSYSQSAVEAYGQLKVSGTKIVSATGNNVQLQGMSLFWSNWQGGYYKKSTIEWLKNDWCINVIRAAMAVDVDNSGYMHNKAGELAKVETVIQAAIDLGIYVIVDFHSHHASDPAEEAIAIEFFGHISEKYGNYPNIIYEPFNEPLGVSWTNVLKPYHQKIINVIRKNDPDNIIVLGSPSWDQNVDEAADDPMTGSNIAYSLHYYASTHKQSLRNKAQYAINKGLCLFVTEYGVCEADGNGVIDVTESNLWWDFLAKNSISHCNWSISDKDESASALQTNVSPNGNWVASDLRESGILVRNKLKSNCPNYGPEPTGVRVRIPAKIETEAFTKMQGIRLETTTDVGGGENVKEIDAKDFLEYEVTAPVSGKYNVEYRVASSQNASFELLIDNVFVKTINISATGGLQNWTTVLDSVDFTSGDHTIKLLAVTSGWSINYLTFLKSGIVDCNGVTDGKALLDNCNICAGGNTGIVPNSTCIKDCNGVWGGTAVIDNCKVCAGGNTGVSIDMTCSGNCNVGLSSTGAYDDYSLVNFPSNPSGAILPTAPTNNASFQATFKRNPVAKNMNVSVNQAQGQYNSFSYTFGNGNSLNLSAYATLELTIKNISPYDVKIDFALEDIYGRRAYVSRDAVNDVFANSWQYEFSRILDKGKESAFVFDFAGAVSANYTTRLLESNIDFTKIANVQITIRNKQQTATYQPLKITDAQFEISHFKIGRCGTAYYVDCEGTQNGQAFKDNCNECVSGNTGKTACPLAINDDNEGLNFSIHPNPSMDFVEIQSNKQNLKWSLFTAQGVLLKNGTENIVNIKNLEQGVYFININGTVQKIVKQ